MPSQRRASPPFLARAKSADWVKWGAFALSIVNFAGLQCEKSGRQHRDQITEQGRAFRLGRRVTVYESRQQLIQAIEAAEAVHPETLRTRRSSIDEAREELLGGAEMAAAATQLGINLSAYEDVVTLEGKVWGQISDSFEERTKQAYRLGRLLGSYDERASLYFSLSPRTRRSKTPELVSQPDRAQWLRDVGALLEELRIPGGPPRMAGGLWAAATDGRALLNAVEAHFLSQGSKRAVTLAGPAVRRGWSFPASVAHEGGYFGHGSVLQIWTDSLSESSEIAYLRLLNARPDSSGFFELHRALGLAR